MRDREGGEAREFESVSYLANSRDTLRSSHTHLPLCRVYFTLLPLGGFILLLTAVQTSTAEDEEENKRKNEETEPEVAR